MDQLKGKKLISELGRGSYGLVYHVKSPQGKTDFALKINFAERHSTGPNGYNELQTSIELEHVYIMRIIGVETGDLINATGAKYGDFIAKELRPDSLHFLFPMAKFDLRRFIDSNINKLNLNCCANICLQLSLAIEFMHSKGFVHRDIKSENVLITEDSNGILKCKISDLGMSKYYLKYDVHSPIVTTAYYRAPELVLGCSNYDKGIDVWSMGCLFYEVFSGERMIQIFADNSAVILKAMVEKLPYTIPLNYVRRVNPSCVKFLSGISMANSTNFIKFLPTVQNEMSFKTTNDFNICLSGALKFDPSERLSMKQIIDCNFFAPYRSMIDSTRKLYPPVEPPSIKAPMINRSNNARKIMVTRALNIFNNRSSYRWYTNRILFLAIYNFDKMLSMNQNFEFADSCALLYFMTTIYISIKLSIHKINYKFSMYDVFDHNMKTESEISKALGYEDWLVKNVLKYRVSTQTVFDHSLTKIQHTDSDIASLLHFVLSGDYEGLNPQDGYNKWLKFKIEYDLKSRSVKY